MILYNIDCNLTDKEFLYVDLFIITSFAFLIGKTDSFDGKMNFMFDLNVLRPI